MFQEEGGAAPRVLVGGGHDLTGPVHVEGTGGGEAAGDSVARVEVLEGVEGMDDGQTAGDHPGGGWVLLVDGYDSPLEGGHIVCAAGLEAEIRLVQFGEKRPHVTEGRLHRASPDGLTALGCFAEAVLGAEELEGDELVIG